MGGSNYGGKDPNNVAERSKSLSAILCTIDGNVCPAIFSDRGFHLCRRPYRYCRAGCCESCLYDRKHHRLRYLSRSRDQPRHPLCPSVWLRPSEARRSTDATHDLLPLGHLNPNSSCLASCRQHPQSHRPRNRSSCPRRFVSQGRPPWRTRLRRLRSRKTLRPSTRPLLRLPLRPLILRPLQCLHELALRLEIQLGVRRGPHRSRHHR